MPSKPSPRAAGAHRGPAPRRRAASSLLGAALLLLAAACAQERPAADASSEAGAPPPAPQAARDVSGFASPAVGSAAARESKVAAQPPGGARASDTAAATVAPSSMVVRTGWASVEVRDVDEAAARVRALAASVGGYVANATMQGGRHQIRSATLELKVPADRFDEALGGLAPVGTVEEVNVTAEDVGEEYTDLGARQANARRLEERLVQLLATRTGRLEDVLAVERELARVREEIERIEGRMRFLRTRVATSTLTVSVHEPPPIAGGPGRNVLGDAFRSAWANFVGFVAWFIAALGVIVPVGAIALALWWLLRRLGVRAPRRLAGRAAPREAAAPGPPGDRPTGMP